MCARARVCMCGNVLCVCIWQCLRVRVFESCSDHTHAHAHTHTHTHTHTRCPTQVESLQKLTGGVCGVFGANDVQFSPSTLTSFRAALDQAGVANDVRVYDNVGHAFLKGMDEIRAGKQPQFDAWTQCTKFIRRAWSLDI